MLGTGTACFLYKAFENHSSNATTLLVRSHRHLRNAEDVTSRLEQPATTRDVTSVDSHEMERIKFLLIVHDRTRQAVLAEEQLIPQVASLLPFLASMLNEVDSHFIDTSLDLIGIAPALARNGADSRDSATWSMSRYNLARASLAARVGMGTSEMVRSESP